MNIYSFEVFENILIWNLIISEGSSGQILPKFQGLVSSNNFEIVVKSQLCFSAISLNQCFRNVFDEDNKREAAIEALHIILYVSWLLLIQHYRNAVKAKTSNNYVGPISKCTTVRLMWPWTNNDDDQLIMCRRTADIQGIIQSRPQPPRVMPTANKQILQFGQMQFSIWTNTLDIQESRFSSHYPIQAKYFQAIQTKFAIKTNTNTYDM